MSARRYGEKRRLKKNYFYLENLGVPKSNKQMEESREVVDSLSDRFERAYMESM